MARPDPFGHAVDPGRRVHALPRLPYGFNALEPHIDAQTVQIHYRKHHQAYIDRLNEAIDAHPDLLLKSAGDLCRELDTVPEAIRTTVRNMAGGHWNHSRAWAWMTPNASGAPYGKSADAINAAFGSFAAMRDQFSHAAIGVFGSGWAWLVKSESTLRITITPNQDNPLMNGEIPILGIDVWEHAYYLKYQNRRSDYVKAWWHVVNWAEVNRSL